ncbi:MAG TPA: VOC family protein [Thermoanaerobaculia bacterium]|nr:VOC family protein [Thermoanaerobaculia bacterium]
MKAIRSILCAALLSAASAATVTAAPFDLPPLLEPASAEHHVGKVIWVDLATPDLASSKKFYAGLFGWTFQDLHFGRTDYTVASLGGRPVGGLVHRLVPSVEPKRPAWLAFLAVRDVDAAKRTALEHGAKVVREPRTYARRGRQAVFADPEGAVFAVLASGSGDPPDFLAAPGEWIWSSLLARKPDTEAAFYQAVFGYEVFDVPSEDDLEHDILSSDDFARASVNPLPGNSPRRHSHWLNFVRVVDAADAAAKAVALGGRVLVEPHTDRHGGKLAVVADPTGARFGLMEWSDDDGKKEPK